MDTVTLIITLLAFITLLAISTRRFAIPYPVSFVIGGALLSLLPQQHEIIINPQLVFLLLVSPVLYSAAFATSWRDFRANLLLISLLAFGLVLLTTFTVACVFKWFMPSMPWSVGCVLGAIISPPDAVAATAITKFVKIPRRTITIIEGESLVNDASGLILYKFAVAAVVSGSFSFSNAIVQFLWSGVGGILLGALIGWLIIRLMSKIEEITITIVVSVLSPFIIYIFAEKLALSAVLAVVAAGLINGWFAPHYLTPQRRLQGRAIWETLLFIINGIAFVLIGLQLPFIIRQLHNWPLSYLILLTAGIVGSLIIIRLLWIFGSAWLFELILPARWQKMIKDTWQLRVIIAWSGMRGIVSLGAALALPFNISNDVAFPARDLILFLAFASIVGTLIFQGLTLPLLIKWLGVKDDNCLVDEEKLAREALSKAILDFIHQQKDAEKISQATFDMVYRDYQNYIVLHQIAEAEEALTHSVHEVQTIRREILKVGRQTLLKLRRQQVISDQVLRIIQAELDLDEVRMQ